MGERMQIQLQTLECMLNDMYACGACVMCCCLLHGVRLMLMCQDWMWALLDIFIVASSLWEVAVDIIQAVYEHLRVKMCERED